LVQCLSFKARLMIGISAHFPVLNEIRSGD